MAENTNKTILITKPDLETYDADIRKRYATKIELENTAKVTVDSALSDTSTNPVQNKVVKAALDGKQASGNYIKNTGTSDQAQISEEKGLNVVKGIMIGGKPVATQEWVEGRGYQTATQVQTIKVDNATNADKLGDTVASDYVKTGVNQVSGEFKLQSQGDMTFSVDADSLTLSAKNVVVDGTLQNKSKEAYALAKDIPTGEAADKNIDTSISASSTSTNLPTSQAVAAFVEGKGYTTNTGDITEVVAGKGLTGGATSGSATLNVGAGTGITVNADTIEVKYGTSAGTACQGNDSRLSDARTPTSHTHTKSQITDFPTSMPASDVYFWAKAASKPTYNATEVGAVPTSRTINNKALSADITLTKSDVGLGNVDNTADANKSVASAKSLEADSEITSAEDMDNFLTSNKLKYATFELGEEGDTQNLGFESNDGMLLSIPWGSNSYGAQIAFDDANTANIAVRGKSNTWGSWYKLIHTGNIGSQSVNYATSAGTAAKATTADQLGGVAASSYAKKTDIPSVPVTSVNGQTGAVQIDLSSYATEEWVEGYGFLTPSDIDSSLNNTSSNAIQNKAVYNALSNKLNVSDFDEFTDSLTIPTVNNGKLTIKNSAGTVLASFSANQSGNVELKLPSSSGGIDANGQGADVNGFSLASSQISFEGETISITSTNDGTYFYGSVYLDDSDLSLQERLYVLEANVCLQEDTQILMADNTYKSIQDIKYGDMIMSYDMETNELIPCKSYGALYTGYSPSFDHYCFSNGSILKIFGSHRIFDAKQKILVHSSKMNIGDAVVSSNCEEVFYYYSPKRVPLAVSKRKYLVFCETGLYFANDILCGHPICQSLDLHLRTHGGLKLSEEDKKIIQEYADARDNDYQIELSNPEYIKEALPFWKECRRADNVIKECKKGLAARDYKTIKTLQGELSEEEQSENIKTCKGLRKTINDEEGNVAAAKEKIKKLQDKYNIHPRKLQVMETENIKTAIKRARAKYKN